MRRFYDWFHKFYWIFERGSSKNIAAAVEAIDPAPGRFRQDSVLEHCCGSGSLALSLAPRCASYEGRDQSSGMLERARARWRKRFGGDASARFLPENVLDFNGPEGSVDRVFVCYSLHLFPPEAEIDLLGRFFRAARKSVIILDHETSFAPFIAFMEALEGSWYQEYKRIDFAGVAAKMDARYSEQVVEGIRIMEFARPDSA
jgi:ubiquinone/menaquinone biosynthesis C-methylase UbiE